MAFPLDNTKCNPTGRFGPRTPIKLTNGKWSSSFHGGDDLAPENKGENLVTYAVGAGTVHSVGRKKDAGLFIILRLRDNSLWRYCHLSSIGVKAGDTVADGQAIGRIGATGNVTGVHLHLERYPNGQLVTRSDPRPYYWSEWNPAKPKSASPAPAQPAAPRNPTPVTNVKTPTINGQVRLRHNWVNYMYNNLTRKNGYMLKPGLYRIKGIRGGNLLLVGNGRTGWVHSSAAQYVV